MLSAAAGMRFIFGLNFYSMNVTLAMKQMDAIQAHLPREAILALEVGNEVSPCSAYISVCIYAALHLAVLQRSILCLLDTGRSQVAFC
jgi:hypothetical protein